MGASCIKIKRKLECPCIAAARVGPASDKTQPHSSSWASSIVSLARNSMNVLSAISSGHTSLPLSEREAIMLSASWNHIRDQLAEIGQKTFARMFERSPIVRGAFEKFRTLNEDNDRERLNANLETHGLVVLNAVDEVMTSLDDESSCIELLLEQGRTHARFDDMTEDFFWAIEEPFLFVVKESMTTCGGSMTIHLTTLYKKMIRFIIKLLIVGYKQSRKEKFDMRQQTLSNNNSSGNSKSSSRKSTLVYQLPSSAEGGLPNGYDIYGLFMST